MDTIYAILRTTALRDGRISDDEAKMLDSVIQELDGYSRVLVKAMEDGIIDSEEKKELDKWRKRVWNKAVEVVTDDGVINEDEHELLLSLVEIINTLEARE